MNFVANARMYSVSPEAEAAWRALLGHVANDAGVALDYIEYPAPRPLEDLWRRADLGCVQMCGYPIALRIADVVPIAAPIPRADWAGGRAVYRSDFIVREDAPFRSLDDTFGARFGWTVAHSQSGFNAPRHHLLQYRSTERPKLFGDARGNLITARAVLDAVRDGTIDVGPLDAFWHMLIRHSRPELVQGVRILESTAAAPMPAFVAAPGMPIGDVEALRGALAEAATRTWFAPFRDQLLLDGFAPVTLATFVPMLHWHQQALAAGYQEPA